MSDEVERLRGLLSDAVDDIEKLRETMLEDRRRYRDLLEAVSRAGPPPHYLGCRCESCRAYHNVVGELAK